MEGLVSMLVVLFSALSSISHAWITVSDDNSTDDSALFAFTQLLSDIVSSSKEHCPLILAYDYDFLPPLFQPNLYQLHRNFKVVLPIQLAHPSQVDEQEQVNGTGAIEYWFSWLDRPSAVSPGTCAFYALFFKEENLQTLMEQVAATSIIATTRDRFLLWNRDQKVPDDASSILLHPHINVMKFKVAALPGNDNDTLLMQSLCFYCDHGEPLLVTVGEYNLSSESKCYDRFFPDFTKNFHGKLLNGIFIDPGSPNELLRKLHNMEPIFVNDQFMLDVGRHLKFNWDVKKLEIGEAGVVETQLDDGIWTGMLGEVLYGKYDFSPATVMSEKGIRVVDYPAPYYFDYVTMLTRQPQPLYSWKVVIQPYTAEMWLLIFVACVLGGFVFWALLRVLQRFDIAFQKKPSTTPLKYSIGYLFLTLIEENPEAVPKPHTARVFLALWWLFALVITCGYTSKLIGFLAVPERENVPSDFKELTSWRNWEWGTQYSHGVFYQMLVENTDIPYLLAVQPKLQSLDTIEDCLQTSLEKNFACISIRIYLLVASYAFVDVEGANPLLESSEDAIKILCSMILPKHHVATPSISSVTYHLWDSGLVGMYEKYTYFASFRKGLVSARLENHRKEMSLAIRYKQLQGLFIGLLLGLGGALVFFLGEVCLCGANMNRNNKKQLALQSFRKRK